MNYQSVVSLQQGKNMSIVQLSERERLIERILRLPDEDVYTLSELADELEESLDPAMLNARKMEPTLSLDDFLRENGLQSNTDIGQRPT